MRLPRPSRLLPALLVVVLVGVLAPVAASAADGVVCADLQVSGFTVSPTVPIAGQQATIDVAVYNGGTCAATGFTVQWKISPYAPSGPSASVSALGAGATTHVLLPYTFPKAGNFESVAIADTTNAVAETNENNNTQILPVTVQPATTDLSITQVSTSPDHPVQGRVETTSITVLNSGNTAAGPFKLRWVPKPFAAALTQQIDGLAADSSATYTFDYTYQQAGTFTSTATVDSSRAVKETNEFNNTYRQTVIVDRPLPDLVVSVGGNEQPEVFSSVDPVVGVPSWMTFTVSNIGNSPAGSFIVSWKPAWNLPAVTTQINGLGAGDSTVITLPYTFPRAGTFTGTVTVDSTHVVTELSEKNNTATTNVIVAPNNVDLSITSLTSNPGSPTQGVPATISVTVLNSGNTDSGPFLVDWNPDATYLTSPSKATLSKQVDNLGPGQSTLVTFNYAYTKFGNFSTLATVDPRNTVNETNETNNQKLLPLTVQPANIDLQITNFVITPASPVRGQPASADITVKNAGTYPAGGFAVQWNMTGKDFFPKTAHVVGLLPGTSTTVHLTGKYGAKGTFSSEAIVDPFNQVVEPNGGENNNVWTKSVTVVPPQTTVQVSVTNIHVYNDGDPIGSGEWHPIVLAVLDPTASCTIPLPSIIGGDQTIKGIRCAIGDNEDVSDGDNFAGPSLQVTLTGPMPLVTMMGVIENDDPLPPDFMGYTNPIIAFSNTYGSINKTLDAQKGKSACDGPCYTATFQTSIVSSNHNSVMKLNSMRLTTSQKQTIAEFNRAVG